MKNKKVIYGVIFVLIVIGGIFIFNFTKITYTKEFTYLPQYKNMKVDKYEATQNGQFGNAVYKLQGVEYKEFLNKYEKVLTKDGWKITKDKKPENIEAAKGDHIARINAVDSKDYITILIWTK